MDRKLAAARNSCGGFVGGPSHPRGNLRETECEDMIDGGRMLITMYSMKLAVAPAKGALPAPSKPFLTQGRRQSKGGELLVEVAQ